MAEGSNDHDQVLNKSSKHFVVRKLFVYIFLALTFLVIAAAVVATYYGKRCTETSQQADSVEFCQKFACSNQNEVESWLDKCPASTLAPLSTSRLTTLTTSSSVQNPNYRLPTDLVPYLYELQVQPLFKPTVEPFFYEATIRIHFSCSRSTNRLVLHKKNIDIQNDSLILTSENDPSFELRNLAWKFDAFNEFLIFNFPEQVFKANKIYTLALKFKGFLQSDNIGFYKSSYSDQSGRTRWTLASQMAPIEARKAFVCFDEPTMKARFRITVIHDESLTPTSNMPVKRSARRHLKNRDQDGYSWMETEFEETPEMPTYLVALVLSDYECKYAQARPVLSKSVNVSVCARSNANDQLDYSLQLAVEALEYLEQYLNVSYPLPKLDNFGIADFKFSAMENWGLILYRETSLLKSVNTTKLSELNIIKVIFHEIAHKWFGNLVSPKWWNEYFLKEGFARYFEFNAAHVLRPEWNLKDLHVDLYFTIIQADSTDETRAISIEANTIELVNKQVDTILTYGKGSCLMRMGAYILGKSAFDKAVHKYLNKFKFGNADQGDLWQTLESQIEGGIGELSGLGGLSEAMKSWSLQKGLPLVTVTLLNRTHISVKQHRFILDPLGQAALQNDNTNWFIPFTYSVEYLNRKSTKMNEDGIGSLYQHITWIKKSEREKIIRLDADLNPDHQFIVANLDAFGFYRVNYQVSNWKLIIKHLKSYKNSINRYTRAQLINDAFSLSFATVLDPTVALDLVEYLRDEIDFLPLNIFVQRVKYYWETLEFSSASGSLSSYLSRIIEPTYKRLGWFDTESDPWTDRLLRLGVVELACRNRLKECVAESTRLFEEYKNTSKIPVGSRQMIFCLAAQYGSAEDWNFLNSQYESQQEPLVKKDLLSAMACTKEAWLLRKYLEDRLTDAYNETIVASSFGYAAQWPSGQLITVSFVRQNWKLISSRFSKLVATIASDLASKFVSGLDFREFEAFLSQNDVELSQQVRKKVLGNIKWYEQSIGPIQRWFQSKRTTSSG